MGRALLRAGTLSRIKDKGAKKLPWHLGNSVLPSTTALINALCSLSWANIITQVQGPMVELR